MTFRKAEHCTLSNFELHNSAMVNKSLFASKLGRLPKADAVNEAGGLAYRLEPKHSLAQVAATGTFGNGSGKTDKIKGRIKEAAGALTGNDE